MSSEREHLERSKKLVICSRCQADGKKSRVFFHIQKDEYPLFNGRSAYPYYDEDGMYHLHKQAITEQHYLCSEGHSFSARISHSCPNPSCDWEQTE